MLKQVGLPEDLGTANPITNLYNGVVSTSMQRLFGLISKEEQDWSMIAATALGQSLGNAIAGSIAAPPKPKSNLDDRLDSLMSAAEKIAAMERAALQRDTGINDDFTLQEIQLALNLQLDQNQSASVGSSAYGQTFNRSFNNLNTRVSKNAFSGITLFDKELIKGVYGDQAWQALLYNSDVNETNIFTIKEDRQYDYKYRMIPQGRAVDGEFHLTHYLAQNLETQKLEYIVGPGALPTFEENSTTFGYYREFFNQNPELGRKEASFYPNAVKRGGIFNWDTASDGMSLAWSRFKHGITDPNFWMSMAPGAGFAAGRMSVLAKGAKPRSVIKSSNLEKFKAPQTGKIIEAAVDGKAAVPIDKVAIYARGKVPDVRDELRALQQLKQSNRKLFDADPNNAKLLDKLKSQDRNFRRSTDMARLLDEAGLTNTPTNNRLITDHLLSVGNRVTPDNRVWVPSILKGPNGNLQVESTWKILSDQRAYLSTLKFMPISR